MGTNLVKNSQSIALRITIVEVTIIILVSVSVLLSTALTLSNYILDRSYYELTTTAKSLVQIVLNFGMKDFSLVEAFILDESMVQESTRVVIMDYHFNIKVTTDTEVFPNMARLPADFQSEVLSGKRNGSIKGYLYVVEEIKSITGHIIGYVLTLSTSQETILIRNSILSSVLRIIFVASLLGIVFSGYITRRLIEPLQKLETRIREIASGEFAGEIEVELDDEIGGVTRAFNAMSQQLVLYQQSQSRFIQNASHELKSPLMNIQGYAEGLLENIFDEAERDNALKIITEESQRLKNVVEELLYISKIDDDRTALKFQRLSIADVINDAIRTVYTRIKQHQIKLEVNVDEELTLEGSYTYLVRAIANVLDNSVRYAESKITIDVSRIEQYIRLVIIDDGSGFAEEDIPHIFERFYKGEHGNTGLGMAIVADIIQKHGGNIAVENRPEVGAAIIIHIPAELAD